MADTHADYRKLRIAFAGTPDFAADHLRALLEAQAGVVAVYTQPDRPAGRGKKRAPGPVKTIAEAAGLPVFQPQSLRETPVRQAFAELEADILVVVAYGLIIPEAILHLPRYGCINVHASLLPRWRGAAPIQRAIEAGDRETGITVMQMDKGLDTGDMLEKVRCDIGPFETGRSLHDKLLQLGPPALIRTLSAIADGTATAEKQGEAQACYAPKITKGEAAIDWRRPAAEVERQVRAFNPFPVSHTVLEDRQIRVWAAHAVYRVCREAPGTIVAVADGTIEVACGEQVLVLEEVQLPGKKRLGVADVLRGNTGLFVPGKRFDGCPG